MGAPMISTKEDAQRLVEQCRYAPHGKRSWGPTRALIGQASTQQANDYVKVFAMIETREAIENLDSILDLRALMVLSWVPATFPFPSGFPPTLVFPRTQRSLLPSRRFLTVARLAERWG